MTGASQFLCKFRCKTINVTTTAAANSPFSQNVTGSVCFAVNGVPAPVLILKKCKTYIFTFTSSDPALTFMLTLDNTGGQITPGPIAGTSIITNGQSISYTTPKCCPPQQIFYQSSIESCLGNAIIIK